MITLSGSDLKEMTRKLKLIANESHTCRFKLTLNRFKLIINDPCPQIREILYCIDYWPLLIIKVYVKSQSLMWCLVWTKWIFTCNYMYCTRDGLLDISCLLISWKLEEIAYTCNLVRYICPCEMPIDFTHIM